MAKPSCCWLDGPQIANDTFSKSTLQVLRNAKAFAHGQGLNWDDLSG